MLNILKLLPLNDWLWLGLALSLLGYHEFDKLRAVEAARTATAQKYEKAMAEQAQQAKEAHDALQAQIDASASVSNADLAKKQQQIIDALHKLGAGTVYANGKALPADCKFDAQRVQSANNALQN